MMHSFPQKFFSPLKISCHSFYINPVTSQCEKQITEHQKQHVVAMKKKVIITVQISVGSSCPDYTDAFIVVSENESVLCVERLRAVSDVVLEGRMSHRHTILTPLHSFPIDGLHRFHRVTCQVPSKKIIRFTLILGSSQLYALYHKLHASKMIKNIKIICILIM